MVNVTEFYLRGMYYSKDIQVASPIMAFSFASLKIRHFSLMRIYFFIPSCTESILRKAHALNDNHNLQMSRLQIPVNHGIILITKDRRVNWLRQNTKKYCLT